ncbi:arsenate-mycothiol transferase ArsC [Candidatus Nitrospira salsa]
MLASQRSLEKHGEYFADAYGGKKAFLRNSFFSAKAMLGGYSVYRRINWLTVSRVIFVCHGNICRSPYAEFKFRELGGHTISAGLKAKSGNPANSSAQVAASSRGIQLTTHRSQNIQEVSLQSGDLLVAFEPDHANSLYDQYFKENDVQVTLLGLWSPQSWAVYFHDPYGLSNAYFEQCFHRIDLALAKMCSHFTPTKP